MTSRREAPLRRFLPYKASRAATGFPECGNKSKEARLPPDPIAQGSTAPRLMTLRSNSPMTPQFRGPTAPWPMTIRSNGPIASRPYSFMAPRPHSSTVPWPYGRLNSPTAPWSQAQPCPISPLHKPKPNLMHQSGFARNKNEQKQKATRLGGFQVSMVSEAGFEPARPVCGH